MYILSLVLLALSVTIVCSNPKSELRRWFAAFLLFVAIGVLSIALNTSAHVFPVSPLVRWAYRNLNATLFIESNCFMPYTLLVFSLILTGKCRGLAKTSVAIKSLLLAPIIVMHVVMPPWGVFNNILFDSFYTPWSLFYYMLAPVMAFGAWLREKSRNARTKKMIIFLVVILISVTTIITGYALPLAYKTHFYGLLQSMIIAIILICSIIALKYGMLGLRLRIEREHYNTMTGSMIPGAAILSHSIKNEISKIALCTDNIGKTSGENPYISENLGIINNSVTHLSEMTKRIMLQMRDYELDESGNRLSGIADEAVDLVLPVLSLKHIAVVRHYPADISLVCDRTHIREVLVNLLTNACEAVNDNGRIEIGIRARKGAALLTVSDNGVGIRPKDMPYIFNPFFTTKKHRRNYGLGLSYCYGVMKRHGGSIKIKSAESGGTEVSLAFPRRRTVSFAVNGSDFAWTESD